MPVRSAWHAWHRWLQRQRRHWLLYLVLLSMPFLLRSATFFPPRAFPQAVDWLVQNQRFSIPTWEGHALVSVAEEWRERPAASLPAAAAHDEVLAYLRRAQEIGRLEQRLNDLRAKSFSKTAFAAASQPLQADLSRLRRQQAGSRLLVEAIIEGQVGSVIADWRLGLLDRALPPVLFRFEEPPYYLVLSPRAEIRLIKGVYLQPALSLSQREAIEAEMETHFPDLSALVTGIGGFSTWPTMVVDRASLSWILSTVAHEWTHTYLAFYPLGQHYFASNDAQVMNETVADMVGEEVGAEVLRRYYPELVPPPQPTPRPGVTPTPPAFDFNREMRITREKTDRLLAAGKIKEAEAYMEKRRRFMVAHGYYIRKLNQAYFAFHGNYRAAPGGPATPKKDPIGTRMRLLRRRSSDLRAFLRRVRGMTSLEDLKRAVDR